MKLKTNKFVSLFLCIVIIFSLFSCSLIQINAASTKSYFVKAEGSDSQSGTSQSDALKTISKAIQLAKSDGMTNGDTVYVNLVDYNAIEWGASVNYDFLLVVRSNSDAFRNTVNISNNFTFGGDTSFESVIVKNISSVYYGNHSVSFDKNCTFNATNHYLGVGSASTAQNVNESQTVYTGNTVVSNNFRLSDKYTIFKTYSKDVTVVFENEKSTPTVYLSAEDGNTYFEKNLTINVKEAKSINFLIQGGSVSVGEKLQFVVNSATTVSEESLNVLKSIVSSDNFYHIVNASGVDDLITTTDTMGKYHVDTDRYKVIATGNDGAQYIAEDGVLTLPKAGYYVIRTIKIIESATYYVSSSGSDENDGTTSSTSLATIARAVELANEAGYLAGDIITVKVTKKSFLDSSGGSMGTLPKYGFDLVVESANSQRPKITITGGASIANNQGSTTYYKNIELNNSSTQWSSANLSSSNVVFDSNVKFNFGFGTGISYGTGNGGGAGKIVEGQNVEFNCSTPYGISLTNGTWSGITYTEDVNITINNSSSNSFVNFNSYHLGAQSGTTRYNKNVNLNIKSASGLRLSQFDGVTISGAIQLINSAGLDFDKAYTYSGASSTPLTINEALASVEADKYLIYNNTGNTDIITFTKTAGKFAVDTGKYKLTATDGVNTYTSANGYLVLENPGIYTITLNHTHSYSDDCDESCDSCGDIRTNGHVYTDVCDAECDVCGYVRTTNHQYDHGCDNTCNICFMLRTTSHSYKGDCDEECDVCGETRIASEHIFTNSCDTNCDICDAERSITHTYANDCDAVCDVCGKTREPHDHIYYNSCDTDCNVCGEVRDVEHVYDSVCDTHCNICSLPRPVIHTYDNSCDTDCNICGYVRTARHEPTDKCDEACSVCGEILGAHVYDNGCDTHCNLCGEERTVKEHLFDNACDNECAECGLVREVSHLYYLDYVTNQTSHWQQCRICGQKSAIENHKFDNACDKKCNVCNYTRAVNSHEYYDDCDIDCNICGDEREVKHFYSAPCDKECDNCGFIRIAQNHIGGTATCKKKAECELCGEQYGTTNDNHTGQIAERGKIAPTCGKEGYTGDCYCLDCNKKIGPGKTVKATGKHVYDNSCDTTCNVCEKVRKITHYYSKATCTSPKTCKICGDTTGSELGHNFSQKIKKATLSKNGEVYDICKRCGETDNEKNIKKIESITLSTTSYTYNGEEKKPKVTVTDSSGNTVSDDYYTVTYASGRKNVGKYKVTVKFKERYSGKKTLYFTIKPSKTSVSSVSANERGFKATVKKQSSQVTGYQIQYSTSSSFSSAKIKRINSYSTTSATVSKLKSGKKYYVRVRTYKEVDGKKYYSAWSDYKTVTTK